MTVEMTRSGPGAPAVTAAPGKRPVLAAMLDGAQRRCPACHSAGLFSGYLTIADQCRHCGEDLHHHRADDAPPYFAILILGHVLVALVLAVEIAFKPALWVHAALWTPIAIGLALAVLPPIKGALVGLQWSLRMHGFSGDEDGPDPHLDHAVLAQHQRNG